MSVLATLLSIAYAVIATILIFRYGEVGSFIGECFNSTTSDIIMKGIGVIVILIFIVLLFSMYVGCINLMSKWSESIGIFALVAGVLGILYGPAIVLMAITRHNAEWELGYSDPSMSYVEVFNEYEKLKAARRINRKRSIVSFQSASKICKALYLSTKRYRAIGTDRIFCFAWSA